MLAWCEQLFAASRTASQRRRVGLRVMRRPSAPDGSTGEIKPASPGSRSICRSMRASEARTGLAAKEVPGQEAHFSRRHDAGSDGCPESMQHEARAASRQPMLAETRCRLVAVEVDVAAFLAHDSAEQFGKRRVVGKLGEPGVAGLGRPFVHRAPRERDGGAPRDQRGRELGYQRSQAVQRTERAAKRFDSLVVRRLSVGLQDLSECLAVPVLLVRPDREERRHGGIPVERRHQQVAEVADGVVLHVVHVPDAAKGRLVEWLSGEPLEVDPGEVERSAAPRYTLSGRVWLVATVVIRSCASPWTLDV